MVSPCGSDDRLAEADPPVVARHLSVAEHDEAGCLQEPADVTQQHDIGEHAAAQGHCAEGGLRT